MTHDARGVYAAFMRKLAFVVCVGVLCGMSGRASASRHLGVQLRGTVGPTFVYAWQDVGDGQSSAIDGLAFSGNLALGHMIGDDLSLGMDLMLTRSGNVSYGVLDSTDFTAVHLGAGITYWLMPANVYLAASLGAARTSVTTQSIQIGEELPVNERSDVGLGMHLSIGKLWWLDKRWGLGASLSLLASTATNPIGDRSSQRNLVAPTLALSATFH